MQTPSAVAAVLTTLALFGCGDPNLSGVPRAATEGAVQSGECVMLIEANPRYWPLAAHMPLGGEPASPEQIADASMFDPTLAPSFAAWRVDFERCRLATIQAARYAAPSAMPMLWVGYDTSDAVLDALASGQMSWGEANRRRDDIAAASAAYLQSGLDYQEWYMEAAQKEVQDEYVFPFLVLMQIDFEMAANAPMGSHGHAWAPPAGAASVHPQEHHTGPGMTP